MEADYKEHSSDGKEGEGEEAEVCETMEEDRAAAEVLPKRKQARRTEGGPPKDMVTLFQLMLEQNAEEKEYRWKREAEEAEGRRRQEEAEREWRREAEEARRRELAEAEDARRKDLVDMFRQLQDVEGDRRRGDAVAHRQEDDDRRRTLRKEDDFSRDRRELLSEKLKGLGNYTEGKELGGYLDKFERIMKESEINVKEWPERLYARLPEILCSRVAEARDARASYEEIRGILLKAAGETAITYGNQLFEVTGDSFKGMSAGELAEWLRRTVGGMYRECKSVEDCTLVVAMALLRKVLPQHGKTYMEMRKIESWGAMREALEDWLSGRQRENYYKPLGAGESQQQRSSSGYSSSKSTSDVRGNGERAGYGVVKCFNCGDTGHRSFECRKSGGSTSRQSQGYLPRPPTCYSCGKTGHRSPECPSKKVGGAKENVYVGNRWEQWQRCPRVGERGACRNIGRFRG